MRLYEESGYSAKTAIEVMASNNVELSGCVSESKHISAFLKRECVRSIIGNAYRHARLGNPYLVRQFSPPLLYRD